MLRGMPCGHRQPSFTLSADRRDELKTVPMRILHVMNHGFLPQQVGGTKSSTHDINLSLMERGHEVGVLCNLAPHGWLGLRHRVLRRLLPMRRPTGDRGLPYPVWRADWVREADLAKTIRRFRPDLLVIQGVWLTPMIRMALDAGQRSIVYLRDVEFRNLEEPLPCHPLLAYVANSRFTARRHREAFGIQATVIPPLVRPERFRRAGEAAGAGVTFVNPVPVKGLDIAFALAEARPDIPFLFVEGWKVAPDPDAERKARAARLPNVTWLPPTGDMRSVYARTRVLLAPSRWEEAWGRVVTEAQLSGIPALASNRGGLPEAVGGGGILVDPDAPPGEWLSALDRLWGDRAAWQAHSVLARRHAGRPELRPDALITDFIRIAEAHRAGPAVEGGLRLLRPLDMATLAPGEAGS